LVFIAVLTRKFRWVLIVLFCTVNIALVMLVERILADQSSHQSMAFQLDFAYLANSILIAMATVFLKVKFDKERRKVEERNAQLDKVNIELTEKKEKLIERNEKILNIQNNLESLIEESTIDLLQRN
jgi:hypothetical protein